MEHQLEPTDETTALSLANPDTALVIYAHMCAAIAECARVDEVKEIRNKAIALEAYAHQAKNFEAEEQLSGIRMRAERRAGELLVEMAETGERAGGGRPEKKLCNDGTVISTLPDLGISPHQSADWQQLAKIPEPEFEKAVAEPGVKRTHKLLRERRSISAVAARKPSPKAVPIRNRYQASADTRVAEARQATCDYVIQMADGVLRSDLEISRLIGGDVAWFITRARMLPWLAVERGPEGTLFIVDHELRAICERCIPRAELGGLSIKTFVETLATEVYRRRKANGERYTTKNWIPDNTLKIEQMRLLDWIEAELTKLKNVVAASGADSPFANRA